MFDRIWDVRVAWSEGMGPDAGSAQWCIDRVLTIRSKDLSGKASAATSPTRNDCRRLVSVFRMT